MSLYKDASLVMIPSAYKDGKLYSIRPTDGSGDFTFSRGSNLAATRVDVNGLIEKGRENHLNYSNDFSNGVWVNTDVNVTGGQSGYDGSSDAWLITKTAGSFARNAQGVTTSGVQSFSVYAKANTLTWIRLLGIGSANNPYAYYDLSNGVLGAVHSSAIDAKIVSVGNGWYRCDLTFSDTLSEVRIYPATGDGDLSTTGSIYIQDAQLEAGLVATDYIETGASTAQAGILEDMPRLDYSGGASCPALLLEPQRSNLMNHSEYFGDATWNTATSRSYNLTYTDELNPMGLAGSYKYQSTDTDNQLANVNYSAVSGTTYTNSIYVKRVSGTGDVRLRDVNNAHQDFSLSVADGWKRIDVTATASGTTGRLYLNLDDVGDEILIWGAMQEAGSYPTSYIPTYGSSVTRSVDSFTRTGISSLINSQAGVFFVEMAALSSNTGTSLLSLSDGGPTNNIYIGFTSTTNQLSAVLYANGSAQGAINTFSYDVKQMNKIAVSYKTNEFKLFVNGSLVGTDTTATMPNANTLNEFSSDFGQGSFKLAAELKQAIIFPTALTDSECIALTTL